MKSHRREAVRIVVLRVSLGCARVVRSCQEWRAREGESPVRTTRRVVAVALDESNTLGIVFKVAGKLLLRLNIRFETDSEQVA